MQNHHNKLEIKPIKQKARKLKFNTHQTTIKQIFMKPSSELLTPSNHALVLIDFEGQMAFATKSITMEELRNNVAVISGASKIFDVPTIVTTVAEESFSGPVFPEIETYYPQASTDYIDRTSMNTWEDEAAYRAITGTGKKS
jgi:hypothetical protein